jgi:hypothetical protein
MLHFWFEPQARREIHHLPTEVKTTENLWGATRVGSGNFIIVKPKRSKRKLRQLRLKSPNTGMRK